MMKKLYVILLLSIPLFSCSSDSDETTTQQADYSGTWNLVQMTGNVPNSETTGADMEWQERYTFKADGTFLKTREREEITTIASGTYEFKESANQNMIELTYTEESTIIGSCYSDKKEELYTHTNSILFSTWEYCDGPGLKYMKVN